MSERDIVERLTDAAEDPIVCGVDMGRTGPCNKGGLLDEAATTIAALREQVATAESDSKLHAANTEFERNRGVEWWDKCRASEARATAAEARVAELEEALEHIADEADKGGGSWEGNQARKVLAGGEGG